MQFAYFISAALLPWLAHAGPPPPTNAQLYKSVCEKGGRCALVEIKTSKAVTPAVYDEIVFANSRDFASVRQGKLWGAVSVSGEAIIPVVLDRLHGGVVADLDYEPTHRPTGANPHWMFVTYQGKYRCVYFKLKPSAPIPIIKDRVYEDPAYASFYGVGSKYIAGAEVAGCERITRSAARVRNVDSFAATSGSYTYDSSGEKLPKSAWLYDYMPVNIDGKTAVLDLNTHQLATKLSDRQYFPVGASSTVIMVEGGVKFSDEGRTTQGNFWLLDKSFKAVDNSWGTSYLLDGNPMFNGRKDAHHTLKSSSVIWYQHNKDKWGLIDMNGKVLHPPVLATPGEGFVNNISVVDTPIGQRAMNIKGQWVNLSVKEMEKHLR